MPRLTTEDRIKQLEAKIAKIKERAERQKVRSNPSVRFMKGALKSLSQAIEATDDAVIRKPLSEARENVSACLGLLGVSSKRERGTLTPRPRRAPAKKTENLHANDVVAYLKANPGSNSESITKQLDTSAATLRGTMRGLIDQGVVRTEGERRGTRYFVGV